MIGREEEEREKPSKKPNASGRSRRKNASHGERTYTASEVAEIMEAIEERKAARARREEEEEEEEEFVDEQEK